MSDPIFKDGKGVQAYRWLVMIGMAAVGYLAFQTLQTGEKTAGAVTTLQLQMTTLASTSESRLNALSERLTTNDRKDDSQDQRMDRQDTKFEVLANRIWQALPGSMRTVP